MKKCFKCSVVKSLDDFYKHNKMADGHLGKCKECTKQDVNKHRGENIDKIREYDRTRPNYKERIAKNAQRIKNNPELLKKYREHQKEWNLKNKYKRNANLKVQRALLKGILVRPNKCEKCDNTNIQAHHEDYTKPLDIIWLCVTCHNKRHKEIREIERHKSVDSLF